VAALGLRRRGAGLNLQRLRAAGVESAPCDIDVLDDLLTAPGQPFDAVIECSV
jgi:hypothetical protein